MFRNVYWHHAVRAATALYKRIVERDCPAATWSSSEELVGPTDEELLYEIARRGRDHEGDVPKRIVTRWLPWLRNRTLPKRAAEVTAAELEGRRVADWLLSDPRRRREEEDRLARELELEPGEVVVDYPAKRAMLELDLLVQRRDGKIERLEASGLPGLIDLPRLAKELYRTTRVLRLFTFQRREVSRDLFLERFTEG
jgi:uncharacterized protein